MLYSTLVRPQTFRLAGTPTRQLLCGELHAFMLSASGTMGLCEGGRAMPLRIANLSAVCGLSLGRNWQVFVAGGALVFLCVGHVQWDGCHWIYVHTFVYSVRA